MEDIVFVDMILKGIRQCMYKQSLVLYQHLYKKDFFTCICLLPNHYLISDSSNAKKCKNANFIPFVYCSKCKCLFPFIYMYGLPDVLICLFYLF